MGRGSGGTDADVAPTTQPKGRDELIGGIELSVVGKFGETDITH